ncbi:hypothetical protein L1049_022850 [Liquidambar formosana]|uniref:Uncharacterized protein n=1 Tax=Liquidambar formosana TaxID=63359 RepID=A0AAP0RD84_LIQFO
MQKDLNLRQGRLVGYPEDYYFELQDHPTTAKAVANTLSRQLHGMVYGIALPHWNLLEALQELDLWFGRKKTKTYVYNIVARSTLLHWIIEALSQDPELISICFWMINGKKIERWSTRKDGGLQFMDSLAVLQDLQVKENIFHVVHCLKFTIHPGNHKMYS